MSEKKLHIGIIGAGRIGRVHAETLAFRLPEAQIVAITDVNREAALTLAARCGIPKVADSSAAILADPGIDAVLICSSTNTHADLIVEAHVQVAFVSGGRARPIPKPLRIAMKADQETGGAA